MKFAQILDTLMNERHISNYEMSKKTGISDSLIGYWRKGERVPKADNLLNISNFFEVSVDYLLGRTDTPQGMTGDSSITIGHDNNGTATISSSNTEILDEMTSQLIKKFNMLSFNEKIDVMNYVINKAG